MIAFCKIGANSFPDVLGFSDIDQFSISVKIFVDTRSIGQD
jgi:hypothetical protein